MTAMEKDELTRDELWKLYEFTTTEERHFLKAHHDRAAFYWVIVSALLAGTIAGLLRASDWYHFAVLCIGPVLISGVSAIAMMGTARPYRRFLEAVTVRAKIEGELGLTKERSSNADEPFWKREAIVPLRHLESREDKYHETPSKTSKIWVNRRLTKGYRLWTMCLFLAFMVLSIPMCGLISALAIYELAGNL
jgi:hypothetical protein